MLQKIPYDLAEIYRYLTGNYGLCETRPQEIMKKITPCAHVCRVSFKHLPQPIRSHIRSFSTLRQVFQDIFEISRFSGQTRVNWGSLRFFSSDWNHPIYVTW